MIRIYLKFSSVPQCTFSWQLYDSVLKQIRSLPYKILYRSIGTDITCEKFDCHSISAFPFSERYYSAFTPTTVPSKYDFGGIRRL